MAITCWTKLLRVLPFVDRAVFVDRAAQVARPVVTECGQPRGDNVWSVRSSQCTYASACTPSRQATRAVPVPFSFGPARGFSSFLWARQRLLWPSLALCTVVHPLAVAAGARRTHLGQWLQAPPLVALCALRHSFQHASAPGGGFGARVEHRASVVDRQCVSWQCWRSPVRLGLRLQCEDPALSSSR